MAGYWRSVTLAPKLIIVLLLKIRFVAQKNSNNQFVVQKHFGKTKLLLKTMLKRDGKS